MEQAEGLTGCPRKARWWNGNHPPALVMNLTFIVSPDLLLPLAHALVICEMHRQKNNNPLLLNTFVSDPKVQTTYISGLRTHNFFKKPALPSDFRFHNQTMNRSVSTYLALLKKTLKMLI